MTMDFTPASMYAASIEKKIEQLQKALNDGNEKAVDLLMGQIKEAASIISSELLDLEIKWQELESSESSEELDPEMCDESEYDDNSEYDDDSEDEDGDETVVDEPEDEKVVGNGCEELVVLHESHMVYNDQPEPVAAPVVEPVNKPKKLSKLEQAELECKKALKAYYELKAKDEKLIIELRKPWAQYRDAERDLAAAKKELDSIYAEVSKKPQDKKLDELMRIKEGKVERLTATYNAKKRVALEKKAIVKESETAVKAAARKHDQAVYAVEALKPKQPTFGYTLADQLKKAGF